MPRPRYDILPHDQPIHFCRRQHSELAAVQVCAAGALLNVLGPSVSRGGDEQRLGMCRVLSLTMALASVYSGCFGEAPAVVS